MVLLLGIMSLITVIGLQFARQNAVAPRTGAAPDFTLDLYGGGTFTLSEQRGKIIVVNWLAVGAPRAVMKPPTYKPRMTVSRRMA